VLEGCERKKRRREEGFFKAGQKDKARMARATLLGGTACSQTTSNSAKILEEEIEGREDMRWRACGVKIQ